MEYIFGGVFTLLSFMIYAYINYYFKNKKIDENEYTVRKKK